MKKLFLLLSVLVMASMMLAACGGGGAKAADLLGQIKQHGYITVSTDPNYEPQSFLNTSGKRLANTKCPSDQLTSAEMQGFDVDVAVEIGKRLGVETCFATPSWDAITAGNWADKWDISVGSMTITTGRQKILDFTEPYYYSPAVVAAGTDAGINSLNDLVGKGLCVGASTTYDAWANNKFDDPNSVPESSVYTKIPAGITVVPLETDQECAQALASGRKEFVAYATAKTVVDSNIANGLNVVIVGTPVYSEELSIAIDKKHTLPINTLLDAMNKIVKDMHSDGTLTNFSNKWFKADLTQVPNK
jgi:polar amino acid transport system substrate-binding protein